MERLVRLHPRGKLSDALDALYVDLARPKSEAPGPYCSKSDYANPGYKARTLIVILYCELFCIVVWFGFLVCLFNLKVLLWRANNLFRESRNES